MANKPAETQTQTQYVAELPYMPSPEQAALGCEAYEELAGVGLLPDRFGKELAESRMVDTAIALNMTDIPDPHFGDVWKQRYAQTNLARITLRTCVGCPLIENCPGAGVLSNISNIRGEGRPEFEQQRMEKLLEVAKTLTDKLPNFVLKGGLALILYGDPRPTIDLDGDIFMADDSLIEPEPGEYITSTEEIIDALIKEAGGTSADKDTDTTLKHSIPMDEGNLSKPIRVELRKHAPISQEELDKKTALINGIRVYIPEVLVSHKVKAALERSKARDIFDLSWLAYNIPDAFETVPSDALENLASKLLSTNSAGERIIDETMTTELSSAKGGVPSWVDNEIAHNFISQLHESIEKELSTRTREVKQ